MHNAYAMMDIKVKWTNEGAPVLLSSNPDKKLFNKTLLRQRVTTSWAVRYITRTAIFFIEDSSEKGCSIVTPGGSFVSNIVSANLKSSCCSFLHLANVSMPSSLEKSPHVSLKLEENVKYNCTQQS